MIWHLFTEFNNKSYKGIILYIFKPLYNLAKIENYCFAICFDYYKKKLGIKILFSNIYLLIIKDKSRKFGIAELWTHNTLNI